MHKLLIIGIEGNELVARSPLSEIEIAREPVFDASTQSHRLAACALIRNAFESLNAEGFHRANVE